MAEVQRLLCLLALRELGELGGAEQLEEIRALCQVMEERSRSAANYHLGVRGVAALERFDANHSG